MYKLNSPQTILLILLILFKVYSGFSQWLHFEDRTSSKLFLSNTFDEDNEEKDITKGDFDKNGWTDLVVVRKIPFGVSGPREDLLLMNYNGQLEDKTTQFAPEFLTRLTDARDVFAGDIDNDGWTDLVIASTFEDQPVLYMNRGDNQQGEWLGFADSSSTRFPEIQIDTVQFCAVWGGDVTGNGSIDLYFSNYAFFGGSKDVLFVNDGSGHFTDATDDRIGSLRNSAFGTSVEIIDMDNDGDQDIIKISTSYVVAPWNDKGVFILYNDGTGHFSNWSAVTGPDAAAYMFTIADLNEDGLKDVYVVDDGADYVYNGNSVYPDSLVVFDSIPIPDLRTLGFGGNVKLTDLDNDGDLDMGICDVDISIPPCQSGLDYRRYSMMENISGELTAPYKLGDSIWNVSSFDFEFIDIDNNGTEDVFMGLCKGYSVLMNTGQVVSCDSFTTTTAYVDKSANGSCNGTSWTDAFTSVQQAIFTAQACDILDTINVAQGAYLPTYNNNRSISFTLPESIAMLGGYPTGGGNFDSRDHISHSTILSGDIGIPGFINDNSYQVVTGSGSSLTTLDGFEIRYGNANNFENPLPVSGLHSDAHLTLKNVLFEGNHCPQNGFVIYNSGILNVENCKIASGQGPFWSNFGSETSFNGIIIIEQD